MTEKKTHQCHRDGCDSQAEYGVLVHLVCRGINLVPQPVHLMSSIEVCWKHNDEKLIREYVFSEYNREVIRTGLMEAGYQEPDFLDARIEILPLSALHGFAQEHTYFPRFLGRTALF